MYAWYEMIAEKFEEVCDEWICEILRVFEEEVDG